MRFDRILQSPCDTGQPITTSSTTTSTTTPAPTTTTIAPTTTTPEPTGLITLSVVRAYSPLFVGNCADATWFGVLVYDNTPNYGVRTFEEVKSSLLKLYWNTEERHLQGYPCFSLTTTLGDEMTDAEILTAWPNFTVTLNGDGTHSFS